MTSPAIGRPGPTGSALLSGLTAATAGCLVYVATRPSAPDLAAQLARAAAAGHGVTIWWNTWYGGTAVPSYSLVSGQLMHLVGVRGTGILATAAIVACASMLAAGSRRPRATAVTAACAATANLVSGRITFAAGLAVALAGLVLWVRGRTAPALLVTLAVALVSPLAALAPVLVGAAAVVVRNGDRRRSGALLALAAAAPVGVLSLLYAGPSVMPFDLWDLLPALAACAALALLTGSPTVRLLAVGAAAIALVAFVVPSPMGANAVRLPLLATAPLLVATVRRPRARWCAAAALAAVTWLGANLAQDLTAAAGPSSGAAFYRPVLARFPAGLADSRIEVVDPSSHGADVFLGSRLPLARGWERQVDFAENPLFYDGTLSPATYRTWLDRLAVGWVALPDVPLDYGSVAEGALIRGGLPYLQRVWQGAGWSLYRVGNATPLATGPATVTALTPATIVLHAERGGWVLLRARYSRTLRLQDGSGEPVQDAQLLPAQDGAAFRVLLPSAGSWTIGS